MTQITKFLRTRIQELTASIDLQKLELTAYERLFQIELGKESTPREGGPSETRSTTRPLAIRNAPVELSNVTFTGNKTAFIVAIVRAHGAAGAAPKEIREVFTSRNIARSDNLIYTTLSALAKAKKLRRRDGRYFGVPTTPVSQNNGTSTAKRRLSPAAIKRIREGVKKHWAAKRAAARAAAK
jgi:hypothetical protein